MKDDRIYLRHILECIEAIYSYTTAGQELFFKDWKTTKATLRELQELAESTQRLSQALKDKHPEIPWQAIAGFRNVLVHDYLGLSLSRVWDIIERDLPALRAVADLILDELKPPS